MADYKMSTPMILVRSTRGLERIPLQDAMLDQRKIFVLTEITSQTAADFLMQLIYLEEKDPDEPIEIYFNSPGGDALAAMSVYDHMRLMKPKLVGIDIGMTASAASILFLGCEEREMMRSSRILIHDPSFGGAIPAGNKPLEIQEKVNQLMKTRKQLADIITERTGQDEETILSLTARDSELDCEEALKLGLCTKIREKLNLQEGFL